MNYYKCIYTWYQYVNVFNQMNEYPDPTERQIGDDAMSCTMY